MITSKSVDDFYSNIQPHLSSLSNLVRDTLYPYSEKNGFAYRQRVKSVESISDKLETGRYGSFSDIDDLLASSIIIPNLNFEGEVETFIDNVFEIIEVRKRNSSKKHPDVFRFDSTRIICRLKDPTDLGDKVYSILFEVQLITAFEHSWQVATHSLAYKSDRVNWRLLRLASQLRANIEQLDMLVANYENWENLMTESEWYEITYKKTIIEYIDSLSDKKLIDEEHIPTNAARFSENLLNLVSFTTPKGRIYSKEVIDAFFSEFETFLKSTPIPKSITLYQYFLVFILEEKQLNAPQQGFHLCVSGEVTDLFPKVRQKLGSHLLFQFDQK